MYEDKVLYNRIGALLIGIDGMIDYADLSLNGVHGNIDLESIQVPVVGEVLFEWI